jgi:SAM-dependent methyltransferase
MGFKDHFSAHAADYARYRPGYPPALFAWLADQAPARALALDCGTGNGQAALALAEHFARVTATDPSAEQIAAAIPHPRVGYRVAAAESPVCEPASVDLVTVAQALHWFDLERFYAECRRALKPGGVLAAWTYGLTRIAAPIDAAVERFYRDTVGPYWPPERRHIESGYATLPFPFEPLRAPDFAMRADWSLDEFVGYLATWSAVRRYRRERGEDPTVALRAELSEHWAPAGARREIVWPLALRVGRATAR